MWKFLVVRDMPGTGDACRSREHEAVIRCESLDFQDVVAQQGHAYHEHEDPVPHFDQEFPKGPCRYMGYTWALK